MSPAFSATIPSAGRRTLKRTPASLADLEPGDEVRFFGHPVTDGGHAAFTDSEW